jgi:hypothetical protein
MTRWSSAIRGAVLAALVLGAPGAFAQNQDGQGGNNNNQGGNNNSQGGSRSVPLLDPAVAVAAAAVVAGGGAWIARRRRR